VLIPEPLPDFAFLYAFGSVYFGIVSRRRRPPKSKNPPKKWQHLTGITGSLSSESVAWFAPDYPFGQAGLFLISYFEFLIGGEIQGAFFSTAETPSFIHFGIGSPFK